MNCRSIFRDDLSHSLIGLLQFRTEPTGTGQTEHEEHGQESEPKRVCDECHDHGVLLAAVNRMLQMQRPANERTFYHHFSATGQP